MINYKISRSQLYLYVSERIQQYNHLFRNVQFLQEVFDDSARLIEPFEERLSYKDNIISKTDFDYIFQNCLRDVKTSSFKEYLLLEYRKKYKEEVLERSDTRIKSIDFGTFLINTIAKYQNKMIDSNYIREANNYLLPRTQKIKKTFLSYAFDDKGLSFALFLYFLDRNGFLYVDWMWNGRIKDTVRLKEIISNEIQTSDQFLFLRTTASELSSRSSHSIRQWCSWEIGNFYCKNKEQEYVLAFYDSKISNALLDTFKVFYDVDNGTIIKY